MTTHALKRTVVRQFAHPTGFLGRLAGWVMANRPSNRQRNTWAVEQLDLRPRDRVLEVGSGPGLALQMIAARLSGGGLVGIDHSSAMLAQAKRRNRAAVAEGKVRLLHTSVEELVADAAGSHGPFDKILAVNVAMFWQNCDETIAGLASLLRPGGILAVLHQPRVAPVTSEAARQAASQFEESMARASLGPVDVRELTTLSPIAVCVLGTKPPNSDEPVKGATR